MSLFEAGVAALELGRRFIGFEIEKDYFHAAEKRLKAVSPLLI